jgi:hypothetical protein
MDPIQPRNMGIIKFLGNLGTLLLGRSWIEAPIKLLGWMEDPLQTA